MATPPAAPSLSPLRWTLWLAAGVSSGLLLGFVAGLVKPRAKD